MNFQGKILRNGRVLVDDVTGTISGPAEAEGSTEWSGNVLIPPRQFLASGAYTLQLTDGRVATITVSSVASGNSEGALIAFTGCEPMVCEKEG
ncbi:MAG: hypothetical protein JWO38_2789 [Gemmataceae bacterium]|nr:hypothetical protein [Gemmataceae bacterium]